MAERAPPSRKAARKRASEAVAAPPASAADHARIAAVQARLDDLGFGPLVADGVPGPATAAAVRAFQAKAGLPETGTIDDEVAARVAAWPDGAGEVPDAAPFHPDHPAAVDTLGRRAVAEAIATIVRETRARAPSAPADAAPGDGDRTFIVHVHGRWGSGKTSILNFLRRTLTAGGDGAEPWVVVDYNAWRNQGHGPAWWTLLNRVHTAAVDQLGDTAPAVRRRLVWRDALWRLQSGWLPYALAVLVVVLLALIWSLAGGIGVKDGLAVVVSAVTIATGLFAFGRTYRIGSARTAETLLELTRDPLRPLTRRYDALIEDIGRPVAVFVDDLDRCEAAFVVELLQSIQTLYRRAPVVYVVAADRDWITCAYEQVYDRFKGTIGEPGRPLGHLFLEKIFQLSITVPNLSPRQAQRYWQGLLRPATAAGEGALEALRADERARVDALDSEQDLRTYLAAIDDPDRRLIAGALGFARLQAAPLRAEREHFLASYAGLVEPNPRAMKRLVNAYGFKRGFELMAGQASEPDALVRWTILELRWPTLAAHLAKHPEDVHGVADGTPGRDPALAALLADDAVQAVIGVLHPGAIRDLVGGGPWPGIGQPTAA